MIAQGQDTSWITAAVYAVLFTGGGVALIVVGVCRRLARARWQREDDLRLLHPDAAASADDRPPAAPPGGGWLIAAGVVALFLGLGHVLHVVVTLHLHGVI